MSSGDQKPTETLWGFPVVEVADLPTEIAPDGFLFGDFGTIFSHLPTIKIHCDCFKNLNIIGLPSPGLTFTIEDHPIFTGKELTIVHTEISTQDSDYLLITFTEKIR